MVKKFSLILPLFLISSCSHKLSDKTPSNLDKSFRQDMFAIRSYFTAVYYGSDEKWGPRDLRYLDKEINDEDNSSLKSTFSEFKSRLKTHNISVTFFAFQDEVKIKYCIANECGDYKLLTKYPSSLPLR